jgi:hypothetical protein
MATPRIKERSSPASAVISAMVRFRCLVASACTVITAAPAAAISGTSRRGSSTIRWASTGIPVEATAATKAGPTVSWGQKTPSITSTWAQAALPRRCSSSAPSLVRSAVITPALSFGEGGLGLVTPAPSPAPRG